MTLVNYIYLPKSIQKVIRGVLSLYKGVVLNEVVQYVLRSVVCDSLALFAADKK